MLGNWIATDDVLGDDPIEDVGRASVVPDAVGIDHRDGAIGADPQTISLCAQYAPGLGETEFAQPGLEELPRLEGGFAIAALGLGLVAAQEDVTAGAGDAHRLGCAERGILHWSIIHR